MVLGCKDTGIRKLELEIRRGEGRGVMEG